MLQNLTNFFNLIKTRKIKTQLEDSDLIAVGTRDNTWGGNYQPSAITYEDLAAQIGGSGGSISLTTSGISGPASLTGTTLNIPDYFVYTHEIGEYVPSQGGVIFHRYLDGGNENYLVVDTTDLSVSAQWASINVDIPNVESVWDGLTNTSNLILAGAGSGITSGTAAVLCDNSTNNGQTDWYLPAAYELATMWNNNFSVAIGLEQAGGQNLLFAQKYATSTEIAANTTYWFDTLYGNNGADVSMGGKTTTRCVRAVRKFSLPI